jgi:DinB superfamily
MSRWKLYVQITVARNAEIQMNHSQTLCASVQAKIYEQIERTEHLISLVPTGRADWVPAISGAWPLGILLGHLLDCLAGFCAVLHAAAPNQLARLTALRGLPVNHDCSPEEALGRMAAYRGGLDEGFAALQDSDLAVRVPTVFVKNGEPLLTLLLGNLEHLINHKHQLFMYLKMMGVNVQSADLYRFRAE